MTVGNRLPSYQRDMEELRKEIRALWQALRNAEAPPYRPEVEIVWSWAGALTGDTTPGPRWRVPYKCKIVSVTVTAGVAGDDTSEFDLFLNGVFVETFGIGAGVTSVQHITGIMLLPDDVVYVAGTSTYSAACTNVGVIARYRKLQPGSP